jgi:hypothetical protein
MRSASLRRAGLIALCLSGAVACSSFSGSDVAPAPTTADGGNEGGNGGTDSGSSDATAPAPAFLSVFVSSKTHNGQFPPATGGSALTGFSGADSFCKTVAEGSTVSSIHGLKWVAWLSTTLGTKGNARDRVPTSSSGDFLYEYRLTDGVTQVFPKGFNFDSSDAGPQSPQNLRRTPSPWTRTARG